MGIPEGALPYWNDYTMDRVVFGGLVALSLATTVVFGLIPALQASRTDVNRTLKDGGRANTGSGMGVLTGAFLSVELALAMILLGQVAVASYIANRAIPTDPNINTTEVVTAAVTLPVAGYATADSRKEFFTRLEERLNARAEVVSVARASILPGGGSPQHHLQIRGSDQPQGKPLNILTIHISPRYFETLALGVLKGRVFTPLDGRPGTPVAIVNDRFAEAFLNGGDPLGTQLAVTPANAPATTEIPWVTVIGVVPNVRQGTGGFGREAPVVYLPIGTAAPATSSLLIRHRVDAERAASVVRAEAQATDPSIALYTMRTLERAVTEAQWTSHTSAVLADTVTWMSVLLAMVGLYAVTAQRVTLKTREIGLRMALGARTTQIAKAIITGLRVPLFAGLLLGTAGSMAWARIPTTPRPTDSST
jgi:putative ABC transport system permease protein